MTCRRVGAWAFVLLAFVLTMAPCRAQPAPAPSRVFVDEAVNARDVLLRVGELRDLGNLTEAARVVQRLLDEDADRLIAHPQDRELFEPVRARANSMLLGWPDLLEKYRLEHEPRAAELVSQDRNEDAARLLFLTPSGLEASLRFAQSQMEAARFESARMILEDVAGHPDCVELKAADSARLAGELYAYLPREDVRALVDRLAKRGQVDGTALLARPATPPSADLLTSRTCLDPSALPRWEELSKEPLQSVTFLHVPEVADRPATVQPLSSDIVAWMSPCVSGDVVYVCDELGFSALDSATLATVWRVVPGEVTRFTAPARPDFAFLGINARFPEDLNSPAAARGVVVGVTGLPASGTRVGDGRVHALRASDGQLLWSVEVQYLDPRLEGGTVRGSPVIEGDTVVVGVRKGGQGRRVTALYLVGLDLFSGELRYVRLIGSGGTVMWQRTQIRPDATLLDRGVAYRADDMGAVGAIDATTGRTLWVRTLPARAPVEGFNVFNVGEQRPAFETHRPVIASSSLFVISPETGDVIELDPASGAQRARRAGSDLGDPAYLIAIDQTLACISRTGVAFVPLTRLGNGRVDRVSSAGAAVGFRTVGRAVNMNGTLCVPLEGRLALIPPAEPGRVRLHALDRSGNVVSPDATDDGRTGSGHVLVADSQGLHTFLSWDRAKKTLEDRVARAPRDPVPLLSYLQLALRQGKSELAPELADRTIKLIESDRESAAGEKARVELFALLHRSMLSSQRSLDSGSRALSVATTFDLPPIKDGPLLTALGERLMRVAESPQQRTLALFDLAFLREYQQRPGGAVEALQEILADESLAGITSSELALPGVQSDITAGQEATARLAALLTLSGPGPYAPFEDEALHASRLLPDGARAQEAAALARRYPASSSAPGLWVRASEGAIREGAPSLAREYLARGVDSVLLLRRIGRECATQDVSSLATGLLKHATSRNDIEPALLLLLAIEREFPGTTVAGATGTQPLTSAVQSLRSRLAQREGRFTIGDAPSGKVMALEGWQPLTTLSVGRAGDTTSLAPMVSRGNDRFAIFAPSLSDGRMTMLWQRPIEVLPQVVQLTPERTLLYHPRTSAPVLEAVSHEGVSLWKSASLRDLLDAHCGPSGMPAGTRINTPLDGMTRRDDVLFALDGGTLIIAERAGRVLALETGTGKVRWGVAPGLTRVFDVDARAGRVLLVGANEPANDVSGPRPAALALDTSSGAIVWTAQTGLLDEHARWGLVLDDADCVLGTSHKIVRVNGRTGDAVWSNARRELRTSGGGWIVGSALFVLDDNFELRRLSLATGEGAREALPDQGRLKLPFEVYTSQTTLTLTSESGLAIFDESGTLVGIDALQSPGDFVPALLGDERLVTLQFLPREDNQGPRISMGVPARVLVFSHPDGRLLSERAISLISRPDSLRAVDGKLLIDQGICTTVVDIPPRQP